MNYLRASSFDRADAIVCLWARIVVVESCWEWVGATMGRDRKYGNAYFDGRLRPAHRVMYELLKGPIPSGLTLDHLCKNKRCVNPDHLEPVTNRVNQLRGGSPPAMHARATECVRGHAFSGDNLGLKTHKSGAIHRYCRACARLMAKGAADV